MRALTESTWWRTSCTDNGGTIKQYLRFKIVFPQHHEVEVRMEKAYYPLHGFSSSPASLKSLYNGSHLT
ncbi:hypothetical protein BDN71DRAFT_1449176 [Pleurotus eryngii]|uniref:Uncharacterized protein n=1 Tax=Pleurotus eryngii TaxID=5323 RepID=A0A9P5ZV66_PLEER|nr:hypothetical protein BDN71DRAFT_1449176 [Pleurotus eryngii]